MIWRQPGVALLNVEVPDHSYSRQLDALIWTPQRCIAVEVKGFRNRQDGVLVVPPNGPWRMDDGQIADIYGNDVDHNPMNQVRANTLAAKNWIGETIGHRLYIHGLVLVMLLPGQDMPALHAANPPNLTDIVVEDFDVFRYYLHLDANNPALWAADLVDEVITSLGLSGLYGALGVAKCVLATWHSKLGRSATRRCRDRLRNASAARPGVGRCCARSFDRDLIRGRYRSWSRRRVK
ncbi:nuclease-related domain-containing protein [Nocardia sp. NPDC005998]|uniref:nuclease-related domain-containing protein n=1 Tax=Nocardia sp. NPDC005998 TaxID=3156894 RepID=UPI0033A5A631